MPRAMRVNGLGACGIKSNHLKRGPVSSHLKFFYVHLWFLRNLPGKTKTHESAEKLLESSSFQSFNPRYTPIAAQLLPQKLTFDSPESPIQPS
jgi:hypothetical protein